jgi:hypothetical protein
MNYLVRYLIQDAQGALQQLGPEQTFDDLPQLDYGAEVIIDNTLYRVGSLPTMKGMKAGGLLQEVLLVSEEEFERQKATGQVPVASLEPDFNPDGATEWEFRKVV